MRQMSTETARTTIISITHPPLSQDDEVIKDGKDLG
jgi:hypothetical protein